jgi:DNA-binding MarR family transcriptional regulator
MKASSKHKPHGIKPGEFELERFLPYQLSLLTNTISHGISESYRKIHVISVTEWRVMAVLGRFPGLTASDVMERTAMDKVAISRAVKNLEEMGLLKRKTDHEDRRRRRLFITQGPGEKVLGDVVPLARKYEQALLQSLSRDELESLLKTISKLQNAATKLNAEKQQCRGQAAALKLA